MRVRLERKRGEIGCGGIWSVSESKANAKRCDWSLCQTHNAVSWSFFTNTSAVCFCCEETPSQGLALEITSQCIFGNYSFIFDAAYLRLHTVPKNGSHPNRASLWDVGRSQVFARYSDHVKRSNQVPSTERAIVAFLWLFLSVSLAYLGVDRLYCVYQSQPSPLPILFKQKHVPLSAYRRRIRKIR